MDAEPVDVGRFLDGINLSRYFIKLLEAGFASFRALEQAPGRDLRQSAGVLPGHFRLLQTALSNRRTGLGLGDLPSAKLERLLAIAPESKTALRADGANEQGEQDGDFQWGKADGTTAFGRPLVAPLKFKEDEANDGNFPDVENFLQSMEKNKEFSSFTFSGNNKTAPQKMQLVDVDIMPSAIGPQLARKRLANRERDRDKDKFGYMDADKDGRQEAQSKDGKTELERLPATSLSAVRSLAHNWATKSSQDADTQTRDAPRRPEDVFDVGKAKSVPARDKAALPQSSSAGAAGNSSRRGLSRSRSVSAKRSDERDRDRRRDTGMRRRVSRSRSVKRRRSPVRNRRCSKSRSVERKRPASSNFGDGGKGVADSRVTAFSAPPSGFERGQQLSTAPPGMVPTPCVPFQMFGQEKLRLTQVQIRCLLGKGGSTVQSIMRQTGSQIVVTSPPTWAEGLVTVSGNFKPALAMIQQVLMEKGCPMPMDPSLAFDANGPGIIEVPPKYVGRLVGRTAFFIEVQQKLGSDTVIQKLSKYAPNGNQYVQIAGTRWKDAKTMVMEWLDRVSGKALARAHALGMA